MCDVRQLSGHCEGNQGPVLHGEENTEELVSQVRSLKSAPVRTSSSVGVVCRVYERDVFMSRDHCMDLKERLDVQHVNLPQVFMHGHLLGVSLISDHSSTVSQWSGNNSIQTIR